MMSKEPRRASHYRSDPKKLAPQLRSWRSILNGAYGKHKFQDAVESH